MKKNLFLLLALGTYTAAQACPCGCVKVCVDNLADRPAATAGAYTLDLRLDLRLPLDLVARFLLELGLALRVVL